MLFKVRDALNSIDLEWYYSVVDVVAFVTGERDQDKARKYWNKLKSRLSRFESKMVWSGESGIREFELVTKILNNCHQLKMKGKDSKLHPTDAMSPEILNDLVQFIPSRNKRVFEKKFNQIKKEIINPLAVIHF